jgi:hypothetical protein
MESERDIQYEDENQICPGTFLPRMGFINTGHEIKCKNYDFCGESFPGWWFLQKGHYVCYYCDVIYGAKNNTIYENVKGVKFIYDDIICHSCESPDLGIKYLTCGHVLCIECFQIDLLSLWNENKNNGSDDLIFTKCFECESEE